MDQQIDRLDETKRLLSTKSDSLCMAKWLQSTVHLYNGNTQSCHHVKSHRIPLQQAKNNPSAIHNTEKKQGVRAQMLKGERPAECNYCWKVEDLGEYSDRIYKSADKFSVGRFDSVMKNGVGEHQLPTSLEIAFDNICNLKCTYCSPAYSSSWYNEIKQQGPYPTSRRYNNLTLMKHNKVLPLSPGDQQTYLDAFWAWWPQLSQALHTLRVTGGEPLLTRHTWKLFDSLIAEPQPQMDFAINSNLSVPVSLVDKMITKVNQLETKVSHFTLYCSIDCVGDQVEYIRSGLDYDLFMHNLEKILSEVEMKISLSFMVTVNALCVSGLPDLVKMIYEIKKKYPKHHIGMDTPYLQHPEHLSVQILPRSYAQYIDQATAFMRQHLNEKPGFVIEQIQRLDRVKQVMLNSPWSRVRKAIYRRDLLIMLDEMDRRRKLDHRKAFPDYRTTFLKWRSLRGLF